ncbi:MAG: glycosyltransferase family 2 protein [Mariprofundaceae bacterium]
MIDSIAVIISTYNSPEFLRLVLEGYSRQKDKNFSVYIADDGSSSDTKELIESFKHSYPVPIYHVWHADDGFRKARVHNLTLAQVVEPYVLLTDGDCIPLPDTVSTHRVLAQVGTMISGSRILLSADWTELLCKQEVLPMGGIMYWLKQWVSGHINRILPLLMSPNLSSPVDQLSGIHGCHLACFKDDLLRINGFDESFSGWGREDSDLVARLLHSGVKRRKLRGMPILHLWHKENSRGRLQENDALLQTCLDEKRIQAVVGINEIVACEQEKKLG